MLGNLLNRRVDVMRRVGTSADAHGQRGGAMVKVGELRCRIHGGAGKELQQVYKDTGIVTHTAYAEGGANLLKVAVGSVGKVLERDELVYETTRLRVEYVNRTPGGETRMSVLGLKEMV